MTLAAVLAPGTWLGLHVLVMLMELRICGTLVRLLDTIELIGTTLLDCEDGTVVVDDI